MPGHEQGYSVSRRHAWALGGLEGAWAGCTGTSRVGGGVGGVPGYEQGCSGRGGVHGHEQGAV